MSYKKRKTVFLPKISRFYAALHSPLSYGDLHDLSEGIGIHRKVKIWQKNSLSEYLFDKQCTDLSGGIEISQKVKMR